MGFLKVHIQRIKGIVIHAMKDNTITKIVKSCFARGYWSNDDPWTNDEGWRN